MSTLYTIGQMNQLGDALETAGYTPGDVTKLQQFGDLALIKAILNGTAKIEIVKHIIDCDVAPVVPSGWSVEEHVKGGQLEWDQTQKVMNANVLDFLLVHPELIPEEWKGGAVFFWGTIYRNASGNLYVRCLYWHGGCWNWRYYWLDNDFDGDSPAALRK